MRVTDRMMFEQANAGVGAARERFQAASAQLSSGSKIEHPGDDPVGAGLIAGFRLNQQRLQSIAQAASRAGEELGAVDNALDGLTLILTRLNELAVQLSNSVYSANDRASALKEVEGLYDASLSQLNARSGDRFLFGGNKDNAPPFDNLGAYSGDTATRQIEISPGVLQDVSVRADVMMGVGGAGGNVDVLATISQLRNALATNDVTAVRDSITGLTAGIAQVSVGRADAGSAQNVLDGAAMAARAAADKQVEAISKLADADPFQSAGDLALAEQGLNAALNSAARSFRFSLLDKL